MNDYTNNISRRRRYSMFSMLLALYFGVMLFDVFKIGGAGTLLKYYAVGLILIAVMSLRTTALMIDKLFFFEALYLCLCFGSLLYSINFSASLSIFISIALNFALIILCGLVPCSQAEVELLKWSLVIGSIVVIIATFIFADFSDGGRMTVSISNDIADPNYLNGYTLFALGFCSYNLIGSKQYKLLSGACCAFILYFTLLTGSRGAFLADIAIILVAIIINALRANKKIKFIVIMAFIFAICLGLLDYLLTSVLPTEVAQRFSADFIQEEGTSSRSEIWGALLGRFFQDSFISILFGHGIGTSAFYNTFDAHVAHNAFIDILIGTGVVGVLTYIGIFVLMIKKAWKSKNYFMVTVLVGFVVMSMSMSLITYKPIFNAFLFIEIYHRSFLRRRKYESGVIKTSSKETSRNYGYNT